MKISQQKIADLSYFRPNQIVERPARWASFYIYFL